MLFWAAANRDPDKFDKPNQIVLERGRNPHLAFSSGIHYCVGANVARLEARIVLTHLLEKAAHFRLADETLDWVENSTFRCLRELRLVQA